MPPHPQCLESAEDLSDPGRDELIARFGETAYTRWREARHRQSLLAPTAIGTEGDGEGNRIFIALGISGETIVETDFDAQGAVAGEIVAAVAAHWAQGKSLEEAADIDHHTLASALERFPREARRYTVMAAAAVRQAVRGWLGARNPVPAPVATRRKRAPRPRLTLD